MNEDQKEFTRDALFSCAVVLLSFFVGTILGTLLAYHLLFLSGGESSPPFIVFAAVVGGLLSTLVSVTFTTEYRKL